MFRAAFVERAGRLAGFTAAGHAAFAAKGADIVCAGASAILQAAVLEIERLGIPARVSRQDGFLMLRVSAGAGRGQREAASVILRAAHTGLSAIEHTYRRHVKVTLRPQAIGRRC